MLTAIWLDFGVNPGTVEISNLKLIGSDTILFNDFLQFRTIQITPLSTQKNLFKLTSDKSDPMIIYKHLLDLNGKRTTDNNRVLIGEDDWLFYTLENSLEKYQNRITLSPEQLSQITAYLTDINHWAKQNGKKFYFVIAPDKNKIYGEYMTNKVQKIQDDTHGLGNQLVRHLNQHTDINVIYPYDALHAAKNKGWLYCK